jgi:hypothetical protein
MRNDGLLCRSLCTDATSAAALERKLVRRARRTWPAVRRAFRIDSRVPNPAQIRRAHCARRHWRPLRASEPPSAWERPQHARPPGRERRARSRMRTAGTNQIAATKLPAHLVLPLSGSRHEYELAHRCSRFQRAVRIGGVLESIGCAYGHLEITAYSKIEELSKPGPHIH